MPEPSFPSINHFTVARYRTAFWDLAAEQREDTERALIQSLRAVTPSCHVYQSFPMAAEADLLVWTAREIEDAGAPARFFEQMAAAFTCYRGVLDVVDVLWGVTRPSPYTKGRSRRAIDPFARERSTYLVAYPFTKTAEWYQLPADARQELMNEHIRVGRSHPGIDQLLLYSVGLQDHEFVVVYEMDDLERFSALVAELRGTAARRYTARDTPVRAGIFRGGQSDSVIGGQSDRRTGGQL